MRFGARAEAKALAGCDILPTAAACRAGHPRGFHTPAPVVQERGFHTPAPPWDICARMKGGGGCLLAFDLGQVGHARADRADAVQQVQAVAAQDGVVGVDLGGI